MDVLCRRPPETLLTQMDIKTHHEREINTLKRSTISTHELNCSLKLMLRYEYEPEEPLPPTFPGAPVSPLAPVAPVISISSGNSINSILAGVSIYTRDAVISIASTTTNTGFSPYSLLTDQQNQIIETNVFFFDCLKETWRRTSFKMSITYHF